MYVNVRVRFKKIKNSVLENGWVGYELYLGGGVFVWP